MFVSIIKLFLKTISILILTLWVSGILSAQGINSKLEDRRVEELIRKVEIKAKQTRTVLLSGYQHKHRITIEFENSVKKSTNLYEQYCLNDGKNYCRTVLIEKEGVPLSPSKIQKSREKIAKDLTRQENFVTKDDPFGYGSLVSSIWVDPVVYLRDCQITSSVEKTIDERIVVILQVNNCSIDSEPAQWKSYLEFMDKTEAEIWIDVNDESIRQMKIYAKKEFPPAADRNTPIIMMENTRMPDGYWLFKKIKLETVGNKLIFPNLKNNWQLDFFEYIPVRVEVNDIKPVKNLK